MSELDRLRVPATTVIAWVSAVLSMALWLAGWALLDRVIKLETGGAPMDEVAKAEFRHFYAEHARIDRIIDRYDERLNSMESRLRGIEARQVKYDPKTVAKAK